MHGNGISLPYITTLQKIYTYYLLEIAAYPLDTVKKDGGSLYFHISYGHCVHIDTLYLETKPINISLFVLEVQLKLNVNIHVLFDTTLYGTPHDPFC